MRLKVYLLVMVLSLIGISVGCKSSRTPAQTVKDYIKYMEAGDADKAAQLASKSGMSRAGGMDKFREYISMHSSAMKSGGGIEWIMVEKENITDEVAEVTVQVKSYKGDTGRNGVETVPFHLSKEDGEWKIDGQMP